MCPFRTSCNITSSANKSSRYLHLIMSCCELEFQFLSVPTHSSLSSRSTCSAFYAPNPPSPLGFNTPFFLVSDAGWNTVHQQHSSRSLPVDSSIQDTSSGCLDGVSNSGSVYWLALRPRLLAAYVPVRGYD